jgi:hypothetical protein
MTRPRRVPDAAARRLRLLGYVLVLLGLLAGAASCADAGRSGTAGAHGLVLRADAPQTDVLATHRPDALRGDGPRAGASPADRLSADAPPGRALPKVGLRAGVPPGDSLPADPARAVAFQPGGPPSGALSAGIPSAGAAALPLDCTSVHAPGAPAGECPAASERAPAAPLSGPAFSPPPGAAPSYAPSAAAVADCGVIPAPPGALGTPDLHQLQVQRT